MSKDYSMQDFADVLEDLFAIVEASTTRWNPRTSTEADPGVVLLKIIALLEDKFNFKLNMVESQAYLDSVTDRQYAFDLLMMLGYIMKSARSSTGKVRLSIIDSAWDAASLGDQSVVIPAFTTVTNAAKSIVFFTTKKYTLSRASFSSTAEVLIDVQEGEPFQVVKEGVSYFSLKDIDEDGRLYLGKTGLAQNGVFISTGVSEDTDLADVVFDWTYVDFSLMPPTGKYFLVETSETGEMYIQFPSDFSTTIATSTFGVWGTYTKGAAGNVVKGTLSVLDQSGLQGLFAVAQLDNFYTGLDTETIQQAITQYYKTKDVCNTLVTASDFAAAVEFMLSSNLQRLYSKAFIDTALTRQKKLVRRWYDERYLELVPNVTVSANQVDLLALGYSSDYAQSFKVVDLLSSEKVVELSYLRNALSTAHALGVQLAPATFSRLLAAVVPRMVVRVSNFSAAGVALLKTKIRNYFYSVYKAENISAGEPLSHQRIIDDIQALSPEIQSVTMSDLTYQIYSELADVGGETVGLSDGDKASVVAQAIREGEIPPFKFYNRPNTASRDSTAYLLATNEVFNPVPWGSSAALTQLASGQPVMPVVSHLQTSLRYTDQSVVAGTALRQIALNSNHLLQLRRSLHRVVEDYGFGLQYAFFSSYNPPTTALISISVSARLLEGTVLKAGASPLTNPAPSYSGVALTIPAENYLIPADFSCWVQEAGGTWAVLSSANATVLPGGWQLTKGTWYALGQDLEIISGEFKLASESLILAGSTIAPRSVINKYAFATHEITDGQEYCLTAGEILRITRSSDGVLVAEFEEDDWVLPKNLSIPSSGETVVTSVPNQILQTSQTISRLGDDESVVSTDFVYLLSLNRAGDSFTLTPEGYMLEEGEALVYANKSITEYIMLGPGTILRPSDADETLSLVVCPVADIQNASADLFTAVPAEIKAQACQLITYEPPRVFQHDVNAGESGDASRFPTMWTPLESASVKVFSGTDSGGLGDLLQEYTGDEYYVRLVAKIQTDAKGVAEVQYPVSFLLTAGEDDIQVVGESDTTVAASLLSSLPFVAVLTNSGTDISAAPTLLAPGVYAGFATVNISLLSDVPAGLKCEQYAQEICVTVTATLAEDASVAFQYLRGAAASSETKLILATASAKYPAGSIVAEPIKLENAVAYDPSVALPAVEELTLSATNCGGVTISLPLAVPNSSENPALEILVPSGTPVGTIVRVYELSYVTGFADEVLYVQNSKGESISPSAADYFNPQFGDRDNPGDFLKQVSADAIDWLNTPNEELANPTNSQNYFNSAHPKNNRTLPFVLLDTQEIKVVRGA